MMSLRWKLKHTSGWIEAPGYSSDCMSRHLGIPGLPVFYGPPPRFKGIMRLFILETSVGLSRANSYNGRLADVGDVGGTVYPIVRC